MGLKLSKIRAAARGGRIKWRYHALVRAYERGITRDQALKVIQEGEILEEYPKGGPYPACLMMAMLEADRPLYVALGYDQGSDYLYIITVHWLDPEKWEDPWKRTLKKHRVRKEKHEH